MTKTVFNAKLVIFTKQIETLKKAGYSFITPEDLSLALAGVVDLPPKPVVLSFDDGYRDFYTDVFPILKKEYVKAVTYIVPDFLDHLNYMYTTQVKEIAASGLVEIGAHTNGSYVANFYGILTGQPVNSFAYTFLFRLRPGGRTGKSLISYISQTKFASAY